MAQFVERIRAVTTKDIQRVARQYHIDKTRLMIHKIENFESNNYFTHPYFGDLNVKPTKKFLSINTNHHLKIIKAIIK